MNKKKWLIIISGIHVVIVLIYLGYPLYVNFSKPKVDLGLENRGLSIAVQNLLATKDSVKINDGLNGFMILVAYVENNDSLALKLIPFFKSEKMKKNWKERINKKIIDKKERGIDVDIYNLPHEIHEIE